MWSGKMMANSLETHHILPVTILSISTLISQLGIIIGGYINDRVKCGLGKYMAKLSKTRHFIPIIIIPSKVSPDRDNAVPVFLISDDVTRIQSEGSTGYVETWSYVRKCTCCDAHR